MGAYTHYIKTHLFSFVHVQGEYVSSLLIAQSQTASIVEGTNCISHLTRKANFNMFHLYWRIFL